MSDITTQVIENEVADRREKCPFIENGRPGCMLKYRPDLTEQDNEGTYYHATCGKQWEQGHYDENSDPSIDIETCHAHPIFIVDGDYIEEIADWG